MRQARKFFKYHPELKTSFHLVLTQLQQDPFTPKLELHPLKGKLEGCYAVRITYSYRLTITFTVLKKEIILLDIGSHEEVYR